MPVSKVAELLLADFEDVRSQASNGALQGARPHRSSSKNQTNFCVWRNAISSINLQDVGRSSGRPTDRIVLVPLSFVNVRAPGCYLARMTIISLALCRPLSSDGR